MISKVFCSVSIFLTVALLAGCVSSSEIKSVKSDRYLRTPQRVLIVAALGDGFYTQAVPIVEAKLIAAFKSCNINADFEIVDTLAIDNPIAKKMKEFVPDAYLNIQWRSATTGRYGIVGETKYHFEMSDLSTKSVVWKADMDFRFGQDRELVFTKAIIDQMKADKILPVTCVAN